jgi:hypothetical protein
MAQTKTKKAPTPKGAKKRPAIAARAEKPLERTAKLSQDVLESLESGSRAALEAVRKFVDSVEQMLPMHEDGGSRRQQIVDSAMEMADSLVHTQYEFIRKVTDSAGKSLGASNGAKKAAAKPTAKSAAKPTAKPAAKPATRRPSKATSKKK